VHSESELGEQEVGGLLGFGAAGGSVVSGLEEFLEVLLHLGSGLGVVHLIFRDGALEVNVFLNHESCGQQVVVVDKLDEGDETRSTFDLLLAHGLGNLSRVLSDTSNESVGEFLVSLAFVVLLDNDCLLAGVSSGCQDDNSSFLHTITKKRRSKSRVNNI